jgi:hypothetical protein
VKDDGRKKLFPTASEDAQAACLSVKTAQTQSPSYRLAYQDHDFLNKDELRAVRLQLELVKPELVMQEHGIDDTIIFFGGARIRDPESARIRLAEAEAAAAADPTNEVLALSLRTATRLHESSRYYDEARELAFLISRAGKEPDGPGLVVVTGGGPGIMEAGNRGACEAGAESVGLNIVLPYEQEPNGYITPGLCFQFHYFAIRKMHFLMRAKALIVFPGGYGTLDELFETLTLIQTKKICAMPVLLFGREFWDRVIDFEALVEEGTISPEDTGLFQFVETAGEAWEIVRTCL